MPKRSGSSLDPAPMPKRPCSGLDKSPMQLLDDACLVRILTFLTPLPDRFNAARVCKRWKKLACDKRMWLRVEPNLKSAPNRYSTLQEAVIRARPGDTVLVAPGITHVAPNIRINKPLCLVGGGDSADDTLLLCPRGFDSALEFLANGRLANLKITAELGSCLLHRKGRLTVDSCALECVDHPLDHLSYPIMSTADDQPCPVTNGQNEVSVIETRIEGGLRCVNTGDKLKLQQVRVLCGRAAYTFWFQVAKHVTEESPLVCCKA